MSKWGKPMPAEDLPTLACVGIVTDITPPKLTESGVYHNCRVSIEGTRGASRKITTNLLFREEWFSADFDPRSLKLATFPGVAEEEQERMRRGLVLTYSRLFGRDRELGQIAGLCGSSERYDQLGSLFLDEQSVDAQRIYEILRNFVVSPDSPEIGYLLKQATEVVDGERVKRESYEASGWFWPSDPAHIDRLAKRAQRALKESPSAPSFVLAFEEAF